MAYTRSWQSLITPVSKLLKGVGSFSDIAVDICDYTSNDMYIVYPWKDTITNIAATTLPLVDGVQDYSSPINIYRLTKATIVRTDITPNDNYDLDVTDDNSVDLTKRSYKTLRSCSQQQAAGTLRLECAVSVPTGMLLELQGEYQINPVRIVDLNQDMWFKDQYAQVAVEGLLYWGYKLSDDQRAGSAVSNAQGKMTFTGQRALFQAALDSMKAAEDWGSSENLFPEETIGKGRDYNVPYLYGF